VALPDDKMCGIGRIHDIDGMDVRGVFLAYPLEHALGARALDMHGDTRVFRFKGLCDLLGDGKVGRRIVVDMAFLFCRADQGLCDGLRRRRGGENACREGGACQKSAAALQQVAARNPWVSHGPLFSVVGKLRTPLIISYSKLVNLVYRRQSVRVAARLRTQQAFPREKDMTGPRCALILAAALTLLFSPIVRAQDYPARPVRIVVPFGAGGPADVAARLIGNVLQENFGQPFVIENRTGAGGVIGTLEAAKSPPDGYTLLMMSNTQTANESLVPLAQRKYELMRDLSPIAPINYSDLVIVVHPDVAAKSLPEFIAL